MRRFLSLVAVLFLAAHVYAQCGVERWSVKTGTDPQAPAIDLSTYISSTIYNFRQSTRPSSLPSNGRVAPRETNQYRLSGTLTKYVRESDSDYHLVIVDGSGRTMIIEIPASNCVGSGSPFGTGIARARSQFDSRFTATTSFKSTSTPVTIKGIGFWDFLHGQTGVAPNGIEVHPVLDITFPSGATSTPESMVSEVPEVIWPNDMIRDDDGGRVHVFRGGAMSMDEVLFHGGPVLERPSIHVLMAGGSGEGVAARQLDNDARELERYGVRNFGLRFSSQPIAPITGPMNDLDVQRALVREIEAGRIQHVDENAIYIVILDPSAQPTLGGTSDWLSYHSQFHPTELAMNYVVVRGGLDRATQREAIRASVARAIVNPAGDGWY